MTTGSETSTEHSRFRTDIEGLRALAVVLVLLYHGGLTLLPGGFVGVDVFFVVSGFVITTQLLREVERSGTIDLPRFYGRRAKRLLPAAAMVLLFTALAAWLLAPRTQWSSISGDLVGASLYVVNWVFVGRSVDYLAEDVAPSPVLHFWSLAIEEQFYIVWPLLILGLVWFASHRARSTNRVVSRRDLAIGLSTVVVAPSLLWSIYTTMTVPEQAFFTTTTRLWELGIGALVALGAGIWVQWPRAISIVIGWAGLLAVLYAALELSSATPWPGSAALLPTLGSAAIIVGGFAAGRGGPVAVLGLRGAVWVGALSYSLYLWHWPLLRMAEWQWGEISSLASLLIVAASVLPAWLSFRFVERPIRFAPTLNKAPSVALLVGANLTLVSLVGALVLGSVANRAAGSPEASGGNVIGELNAAQLQGEDAEPPSPERADSEPLYAVITPDPLAAVEDVPDLYDTGCQVNADEASVTSCPAGDPEGQTLVYVIGDSKIGQWMPALDEIAKANGWRLVLHTKSTCAFTDVTTAVQGEPYDQCREWGVSVMEEVRAEKPAAVIVGSLRSEAFADDGAITSEALVQGYVSYWSQLVDQGTAVIALSDNPQPRPPGVPVYECVDEHRDDADAHCTWDAEDGRGSAAMREAAKEVEGAEYVDMNPWVCPEARCAGVWRNILTYRQGSHLTKTYVLALARPLAVQVVPLVAEADAATR